MRNAPASPSATDLYAVLLEEIRRARDESSERSRGVMLRHALASVLASTEKESRGSIRGSSITPRERSADLGWLAIELVPPLVRLLGAYRKTRTRQTLPSPRSRREGSELGGLHLLGARR